MFRCIVDVLNTSLHGKFLLVEHKVKHKKWYKRFVFFAFLHSAAKKTANLFAASNNAFHFNQSRFHFILVKFSTLQ